MTTKPSYTLPWIHLTSNDNLIINNEAWRRMPQAKFYSLWAETDKTGIKWLKLVPALEQARALALTVGRKDTSSSYHFLRIPRHTGTRWNGVPSIRSALAPGKPGIYLVMYEDGKFRPLL